MQMENKSNHPKLAWFIALINTSDLSINTTTYIYSTILDPKFPAWKTCSADSENTIFERRFVIPFKNINQNGLYKELTTMKFCVYNLQQLEIIIKSLMLKMAYLTTYYPSAFHGNFDPIKWKISNRVTVC